MRIDIQRINNYENNIVSCCIFVGEMSLTMRT